MWCKNHQHAHQSTSSSQWLSRGGCTNKELPHHHQGTHHALKKKAWFDEVNMLNWVKNVLAPDVAKFSTGIIPQFV
jgi:hypothetical protein